MLEEVKKQANVILIQMIFQQRHLDEMNREVERRIEEIKSTFSAAIQADEEELKRLDKELIALMKANEAELFDDTDQVNLDTGILLLGEGDHVKIPRDALEKIEAQGWTEAINVVKSVDREVVEAWPVERLTVIGAEKKPVKNFSYEIFALGA